MRHDLRPETAKQQLIALPGLPPPPAYGLIADRVHQLVGQGNGSAGLHLAVSFLLTFWSSATGSKSVLSAVNVAYDVTEQRPFLRFQFIELSMTLVAVLCAILVTGALLLLPPAIDFLGLSSYGGGPDPYGWNGHADRLLPVQPRNIDRQKLDTGSVRMLT